MRRSRAVLVGGRGGHRRYLYEIEIIQKTDPGYPGQYVKPDLELQQIHDVTPQVDRYVRWVFLKYQSNDDR